TTPGDQCSLSACFPARRIPLIIRPPQSGIAAPETASAVKLAPANLGLHQDRVAGCPRLNAPTPAVKLAPASRCDFQSQCPVSRPSRSPSHRKVAPATLGLDA